MNNLSFLNRNHITQLINYKQYKKALNIKINIDEYVTYSYNFKIMLIYNFI